MRDARRTSAPHTSRIVVYELQAVVTHMRHLPQLRTTAALSDMSDF